MITRILVPTDFSPVANNALQYALKLAKKTGADVHLLNVYSIPVADAYFPSTVYASYIEELEHAAKSGFDNLETTFYPNTGIAFKATTAMGFVQSEVTSYVEKHNIDLIVIGTTGASSLSEILIGSNAATIVGKSEVPVLVIPPDASYHDLQQIVYATDYNEPEFPAVSRLIYLADLYHAEITVLHVKTEDDRYFNSEHNFFAKHKHHISFNNWKIVKISDPNIMEGIDRYTEEIHADLLVLAKHNRHFFDRIFHRSLSKRMAYHTRIPLLVLNKSN